MTAPWIALETIEILIKSFSVKDNIDVDGMPTTAACSAYKFYPEASANVVARLQDAGAICIGKTNLDQFATGLNGTRSPYGPCISPFNPQYISGGSSSGSAVSVALHQVSFSIGTDTGGSGRIPASLNNVVGLKDSSGDSDRMMKVIKYFNDFAVFCGHDSKALSVVKRGGAGAITAGTNVCGKLLSFILKNYKNENNIKNFNELQSLLENIRQVITSHEPISLMKAYFSITDNIEDWNNVLPPLRKIDDPNNHKSVLILKELIKKIDNLIANT